MHSCALPQEPYGTDSLTFVLAHSEYIILASNNRLSIVDSYLRYEFSCLYLNLRYSAKFFHGRASMLLTMLSAISPASTIVGIVDIRTMLNVKSF